MQTKHRDIPNEDRVWQMRVFLPKTFQKQVVFAYRDCWLWKGSPWFNKMTPQRASWKLHRGYVDPKMDVKTHCGKEACVNPHHLGLRRP